MGAESGRHRRFRGGCAWLDYNCPVTSRSLAGALWALLGVAWAQTPVGSIRVAASPSGVTVTIETGARVRYRAARLVRPDRIYFDLLGTRVHGPRNVAGAGLVRQIRVAPREGGAVRVVLDLAAPARFSASWQSAPDRLVIEVARIGAAPAPAANPVRVEAPKPAAAPPAPPPQQPAPAPVARPRTLIPRTSAPAREPAAPAPGPPAPAPAGPPKPFVVERIVAKVNNDIITSSDLMRARQAAEAELVRQKIPRYQFDAALARAEANALRDRIDNLLLVQKGKELEINVDAEVSKYLAQIQLDSKITDPDRFRTWLQEQSGTPFEEFRQQSAEGMITRDVIRREVAGRMNIPRAEMRKYYDEHQSEFVRSEQVVLREIFLSTEGKDAAAVAAVEKKAQDLASRARKGEVFGTLARENSDAASARGEGALPPFKRGDLRKEIEDLVFDKERGFVTDPIRQSNGFLILRVEERYQAGLQPFELVENEIMDALFRPRMDPALRTYLTKLRQEAFLQIRSGYVDTGAAPGKDTSWKDPVRLIPETTTKAEVLRRAGRKRLLWLLPIPGTGPKLPKEE